MPPPKVEMVKGKGGLDCVQLELEDDEHGLSRCEVYLFGATVTSWTRRGQDLLFLSDTACFDGKKAIRGGIPLVFPQFGQPNPIMAQHGFARTKNWSLGQQRVTASAISVTLELREDEETLQLWPYPFCLSYEVELTSQALLCRLTVSNPGTQSFPFQALLHTYLKLPVEDATIQGFEGEEFLDKVRSNERGVESRRVISIAEEVDRVYLRSSSSAKENPVRINVVQVKGEDVFTVESSASLSRADSCEQVDVDRVLWNAWVERNRAIADLHDGAYKEYVCIEPGLVSQPLPVLNPGQSYCLVQSIRV
eukprot:gene7919-8736_t